MKLPADFLSLGRGSVRSEQEFCYFKHLFLVCFICLLKSSIMISFVVVGTYFMPRRREIMV